MSSCTGDSPSSGTEVNNTTASSERGQINVCVQTGLGYTVKEGTRTVMTGSDVTFTVTPCEGYRVIGFSYSDYEEMGGNVYKFKNVLYPTVIEVYFTASSGSSGSDEKDPVTDNTSTSKPVTSTPNTGSVTTKDPVSQTQTSRPVTTRPTTTPPVTSAPKPDSDLPLIEGPTNDIAYADSIIYCFNGGRYKGYPDVHEMTVFPNTKYIIIFI